MAVGSIYAGNPVLVVGTPSGDSTPVTASALPSRTVCTVWLSDTAFGAPSGSPPNGGTTFASGTRLTGLGNDVSWLGMADTNGRIVLTLSDSGTPTFYVNVAAPGRAPTSTAVVFS